MKNRLPELRDAHGLSQADRFDCRIEDVFDPEE